MPLQLPTSAPPLDPMGRQSLLNLVLPGETVDEAVRRYVLTVCAHSLRQTQGYRSWLLEATKRYEALRSTRALDRDDPGRPWPRASNIGLPLEAIMGEALIPRFNAAIVDSKPAFRIQISLDDPRSKQFEDTLTDWWDDVLRRKMKLRAVKDETHRNLVVDGDGIEEDTHEERWATTARTVVVLEKANGEFLRDPEGGGTRIFPTNLHPDALPDDPEEPGKKLRKVLIQRKQAEKIYSGPRIRPWRLDETIWPWDATNPDIQELDWFCVQAWKSRSWFKTREGDPLQGNLKNVPELINRIKHGVPEHHPHFKDDFMFGLRFPDDKSKALLWRFFGLFDVDGDGVDEEIVALLAPRERLLLGWRITSMRERPFTHYQLGHMPGRFTGRGIPHMAKGIRDMIDFHLNMSNNRASILLSPPTMYEIDSGFDPDIHQFGTGAKWGPLNPGGIGKIKPYDMPKSQEQLTLEFILFYMSILQRLTGVGDLTLGGPARGSQRGIDTATGQIAVIQEGNVKFADSINAFQELNEQQMQFIDQEFMELMAEPEAIALMSNLPMTPEVLRLPKTFHATGNSATVNKQVLLNMALLIFDRFAADPMFNLDPVIARQLRQRILDFGDVQDIDLPPPEQIQQLQQRMIVDALQNLPDEEKAKLFQGLVDERVKEAQAGGGAPAGAGVNGGSAGQRG